MNANDKKTLDAINPEEAAAYLRAKGWRLTPGDSPCATWTRMEPDARDLLVFVPMESSMRRMAEMLAVLETFEQRPRHEILRDIVAGPIRARYPVWHRWVARLRDNPEYASPADVRRLASEWTYMRSLMSDHKTKIAEMIAETNNPMEKT